MSVILTYAQTGPDDVLTLPSPEWGNTTQVIGKMSLHQAMSTDIYTYKRSSSAMHLTMDFQNVSATIADSLKTFIKNHFNHDIELTDANGKVWGGRLLTHPLLLNDALRDDSVSLTLDFEGIEII